MEAPINSPSLTRGNIGYSPNSPSSSPVHRPGTTEYYLKEIARNVKTKYGVESKKNYESYGKARIFFAVLFFLLFLAPFVYWCYNIYKINTTEILMGKGAIDRAVEVLEEIKYLFISFQAAILAGILILIINTVY